LTLLFFRAIDLKSESRDRAFTQPRARRIAGRADRQVVVIVVVVVEEAVTRGCACRRAERKKASGLEEEEGEEEGGSVASLQATREPRAIG